MESQSDSISDQIEDQLAQNAFQILDPHGVLIYKTFLNRLLNPGSNLLLNVASQFRNVSCAISSIASSQTSEIYIICEGMEGTPTTKYPDIRLIKECLNEFPVMKTAEEDYQRALYLTSVNMYQGIPGEIITDHVDELSECVSGLGVEAGTAALLGETIRAFGQSNKSDISCVTIFVILSSILHLTLTHQTPPKPPSDSKVYNLGSFIVAVLNWISLSTKSPIPHINAQSMIDNNFTLSWNAVKLTHRKTKKTFYQVQYAMSQILKGSKSFHLDANMAKIGQIQRCLIRVFGYNWKLIDSSKVDATLKIFSDGLSNNTITRLTDLIPLCQIPVAIKKRFKKHKQDTFEETPTNWDS